MYREIKAQLETANGIPISLMTDKIADVDALLKHEYVRKAQPFNPGQKPEPGEPGFDVEISPPSIESDDDGNFEISGPDAEVSWGDGGTAESNPGSGS